MRKGYLSVPIYSEKEQYDDEKKAYYLDASEVYHPNKLVNIWIRICYCFLLSPRQREKITRRSLLLYSKKRGIKLLFTLVFFIVSLYFIDRFIDNYGQLEFALPTETIFDLIRNIPSSDKIHSHFLEYESNSTFAGSEQDQALAAWTQEKWIEYGINAQIETFYPLLNYPKTRKLAMPEYESTTTSFHAYSADGNVTGPAVYVNYGRLKDFQYLQVRGTELNGTIAFVRQGLISNALKIKIAQELGCIGIVLFSDSTELLLDQHESVQYLTFGDPTTPGYASNELNTTHINLNETESLPKIPSLTIPWQQVQPYLKTIDGFQLDRVNGPSKTLIQLVNTNDYQIKPIWNVIGTIKGTVEPNHTVIIGHHRDGNASSGSAILMELARTLGVLISKGWKPKRTIMMISWDAKEYGMVGSTEWIEKHSDWLKAQVVAYLNVDDVVSGKHFYAESSPLLNRLLYQVTDQVIDPETSQTVYSRWKSEKHTVKNGYVLPLTEIMGLDSDHVGFFYHLGISSLSMGFKKVSSDEDQQQNEQDGMIGLIDNQDPLFEYHQTLTKIWGLLTVRLSSDPILPFHPEDYTAEITRHVQDINIKQGCLTLPYISSALHSLAATSIGFERLIRLRQRQLNNKKRRNQLKKQVEKMNKQLMKFESCFLNDNQTWFKHTLYGPDSSSGWTIPFPKLMEATQLDDHIKQVEQSIGHVLLVAERTLRDDDNDIDL